MNQKHIKVIKSQMLAKKFKPHELWLEAEKADREFKQAWNAETKNIGYKRYKETEKYERLLMKFDKTHHQSWEFVSNSLSSFRDGNMSQLPLLLAFLEWEGRFFRSGYMKAEIAHAINQLEWPPELTQILKRIFLASIEFAGPREFKKFEKWVPRFWDHAIKRKLEQHLNSSKKYIRDRAERILNSNLS